MPPPPPPLPPPPLQPSSLALACPAVQQLIDPLRNLKFIDPDRMRSDCLVFKLYRHVTPLLQTGPTCGLVALSMALRNNLYDADKLKELAVANQWSMHGEMFSCKWMARLGEMAGAKCICLLGGLVNSIQKISDCLLDGGFVLVPYDADYNHSPGMFGGKFAHWSLLLGMEIQKVIVDGGDTWQLSDGLSVSILPSDRLLFQQSEPSSADEETALFHVFAMQGKSQYAKIWPFSRLAASNANLRTVNQKRIGAVCLPDGGIYAGLCNQAVLIWT